MRSIATAVVLAAALSVLVACGGGDDAPQPSPRVLQRSDVPAVKDIDVGTRSRLTAPTCAAMASEYNLTITGRDDPYVSYWLEGGGYVRSAVQSASMDAESIHHTFDRLETMIAECVEQSSRGDDRNATFARLPGLPPATTGFVTVSETSNGPETIERVYSRIDDQHAVVVTVVRPADAEHDLTVADLLPVALERAGASDR